MRTPILLLSAVLSFPAAAQAAPVEDAGSAIVFKAMQDELERTVDRLEMGNLGKPYFVCFTVEERRRLSIEGEFGALMDPEEWRARELKLDLRVGKPAFDSSHYVGKPYWQYSPPERSLVTDDDYDALRYDMWTAADEAYKHVLETYSQKKAYKKKRMIREEIPDLSKDKVQDSVVPKKELPFDRPLWEERVRKLSAVFRDYPAIQKSKVAVYWMQTYEYIVDSQGRKVLKPKHDYELVMQAETQAEDGMQLHDTRRFIRQSLDDMPPMSSLETAAMGLAKDMSALTKAPLWDETYIGPVLLEGQAAGEFFNQLLARNVSSPREVWVEDDWAKKYFPPGAFAGRLGLRVVSPILNVVDDPGMEDFEGTPLIGHYAVDDQGIPAQKVTLVEKGILKDVLMSRAPIKERSKSNGHGRAPMWETVTSRIGTLVISSEKSATEAELKGELLRQAKEFGLKYGLIIRRIDREGAKNDFEDMLAPPLLVYKAYVKNGKEELVRNADFTGVTLRALRDVSLTSRDRQVYNYYQIGPYAHSRGQVQASIVHPSVLVAEMELKKSDKKPEKLPYLKHPYFD